MRKSGGTVELLDGTVIRASRAVIAACPVHRVPDMVGDALPASIAHRLRRAPANATGLGTFTINAALSGRLELPNHQPNRTDGVDLRKPAIYMGSLEEVVAAGEQSARGELPDRTTPAVSASCPPSMRVRHLRVKTLFSSTARLQSNPRTDGISGGGSRATASGQGCRGRPRLQKLRNWRLCRNVRRPRCTNGRRERLHLSH